MNLTDLKTHLIRQVLELFAGQPEVAVLCLEPGESPGTFVLWGPSDCGLGLRKIQLGAQRCLLDCRPSRADKARRWLMDRGFVPEDGSTYTWWTPPGGQRRLKHRIGGEDLPRVLRWAVRCLCLDRRFADPDNPTAEELAAL